MPASPALQQPDILFVMTDQQRFDTIAAAGNSLIHTPNMDRLVRRGVSLVNAYSTCPVCLPARYTIRTGCEPPKTGLYANGAPRPQPGQSAAMEDRCGPYLARVMRGLGYRTWGVGKFHAHPLNEDLGFDVHLRSEEMYSPSGQPGSREEDAYAAWLYQNHPAFRHVEQPHGERSDFYFVPQTSPLPAELTVEHWAADRAVELIAAAPGRPYFGMVSFVGPHPPLAPPVPYNRMYDPDRMPAPLRGPVETDHRDPQIPAELWNMFADDISDFTWKQCRARYYGEISYIDAQLGRILDAVESRGDSANTLICFFSDHGEMLGDHRACQKYNFFEQACRVPFLVSWPVRLPADTQRAELVSLADLFAIATAAGGAVQTRDGIDLLGMIEGRASPRDHLLGLAGWPGTAGLRVMVRQGAWKYIFIANGGGELLFDLAADPNELADLSRHRPDDTARLRRLAAAELERGGVVEALDSNGDLRVFQPTPTRCHRVYQFASDLGICGYPDHPAAALTMGKPPPPTGAVP